MHPNDLLQGKPMPKHITQQIYENPTGFAYGELVDAYMMVFDRMNELNAELNEARDLANKWRAKVSEPIEWNSPDFKYAFPWELERMQIKDA